MTLDPMTPPPWVEVLLERIQEITDALGTIEANVSALQRRAVLLEQHMNEAGLAGGPLAEATPQQHPPPALSLRHPPRVAPLIAPRRTPRLDFLLSGGSTTPIAFRPIPVPAAGEVFPPLTVISREQQLAEVRAMRRRGAQRARWQEAAAVAVPVFAVAAVAVAVARLDAREGDGAATPTAIPTAIEAAAPNPTQPASPLPETPALSAATVAATPAASPSPERAPSAPASPTRQTPAAPTATTATASPSATASPTPVGEGVTTTSTAPVAVATPTVVESTPTPEPTPTTTEDVDPIAPTPGGVGSTRADIEQIFGVRLEVTPDGESVYQDATVLVFYAPSDRAVRVTFVLDVDDLVFDRTAADELAAYYRPPGAILQKTEAIAPDLERRTYATPGLAAFIAGEDMLGHDPGIYVEDFSIEPATGRVTRIVTSMGPGS